MGKGDWTYGKVVVRAKLLIQQGMWPAIWMMPTDEAHYGGWPASGEIDIMELIGGEHNKNQSRVYSTLHFDSKGADGAHGHDQGSMLLPDGQTFADDYHDFQVEWLPGVIRFYVDGNLHYEVFDWQTKAVGQPEYYTYPAPFDRPFYLITFDVADDSFVHSRISFDMGNLAGEQDAQNIITLSDVKLINMGKN